MSDDDRVTWFLTGARAACRRLGIGWTVELECGIRNQLLAAELGILDEADQDVGRGRDCGRSNGAASSSSSSFQGDRFAPPPADFPDPEPIRPRRSRTNLEAFAEAIASGCTPERAGEAVMGRGGRT